MIDGLSVTGVVHPDKIYPNNMGQPGDMLVLTKKLGVGIICTANRIGEASKEAMQEAITSMTTLNKKAAEISRQYRVHACTDVTGFGFLGHLHEMMDGKHSCHIFANQVPIMQEVLHYADEFYLTAAAQKNRNHVGEYVQFEHISFAMEEVLFDPQTSGGLLLAVHPEDVQNMVKQMQECGLPATIVGEIVEKEDVEIRVM